MSEETTETIIEKDETKEQTPTAEEHVEEVVKNEEEEPKVSVKELQRRLNEQKKGFEKQLEEAEKLRKMNAEQKQQYEMEKLQQELAVLKAEKNRNELAKEAREMLNSAGVSGYSEELLAHFVKDDADATKAAIDELVTFVSRIKKENARQGTPRNAQTNTVVTNNSLETFTNQNRLVKD